MKPYSGLKLFLGFGLATALLGGAGTAHAQRWDDRCANRIAKDQDEVNRAVNRYGYDSRQAQHERDELQADAEKCGYSRSSNDYRGYRQDSWGDRDDRWRNQAPEYDRGYYGNGRSGSYSPAYDVGYRDGVAIGQKDSQKRKSFRPQKNDRYEDADNGYDRRYGDKNQYKNLYREGFQRGYADGYGQWR